MKKILVAEDDEFLVNAYKDKLIAEGYEVTLVRDGESAVAEAIRLEPHLIILDVIMPKKNGIETLKELKKNSKTKDIPILMASNTDTKESMEACKKYGCIGYYIKSDISLEELVDTIEQNIS